MVPKVSTDDSDDMNNSDDNVLQNIGGSHNFKHARVIDDDGSEDPGGHQQGLNTDDDVLETDKNNGAYTSASDNAEPELNIEEQVTQAENERPQNEE